MKRARIIVISTCGLLLGTGIFAQRNSDAETEDLLPEWTFTAGIEGPAADSSGNLYAVNYGLEGTIGVVHPDGSHHCLLTLPKGSTGNGIRFADRHTMYVADYTGHNVLKIAIDSFHVTHFAHEPRMNQPNDLAVSPAGNIYASDPNWENNSGQLWLIRHNGTTQLLETNMGTTNGVEVSPDGKRLYVNESVQLVVWVYDIHADGTIGNKRLFHTFCGYGMDGMRCDSEGNLYLCRYNKGTIAILSPQGVLLREVRLKGKKPSNITFGGQGNLRCYVTLQDRGCFETFIARHPGRE